MKKFILLFIGVMMIILALIFTPIELPIALTFWGMSFGYLLALLIFLIEGFIPDIGMFEEIK